MSNIRINPSLMMCPMCGESTGVALMGAPKDDKEAPSKILDNAPCQKCSDELDAYKRLGFLFLIAHEERLNPWHAFKRLTVVKRESVETLLKGFDTSKGAAWIDESLASHIGL